MQARGFSGAHQLLGVTLDNRWRVVEKIASAGGETTPHFSVGYIAEAADGQRAFVKAIDCHAGIASADDPLVLFRDLINRYLFEKSVCETCAKKYMQHVVVAIHSGYHQSDPTNILNTVPYIVFELAEGDIRKQLNQLNGFDLPWRLRTLHHVAVGLQQLHNSDIAHQDLKPSNVLTFDGRIAKVADLGRASKKDGSAPHESFGFTGDRRYAPIECMYGWTNPEWNVFRCGTDMYMFGSLVVFLFSKVTIQAALLSKLNESHQPFSWQDTYENALPYVRAAHSAAMAELSDDFPPVFRDELIRTVNELCEPDPQVRGHPEERRPGKNQYALERYVSRFDLMASRAELSGRASN